MFSFYHYYMQQIAYFFRNLFDTSDFPARWHCGRWSDFHGWLYIISNLMIWSAYFAIPLIIIRYITNKQNKVLFHPLYFLFAAFILACGTTHLLDAIIFWTPVYRISALVLLLTGIISWITVFYLIRILPTAFSLKSPKELQAEVDLRKVAEEELTQKNAMLEEAQRIARISYWQWNVKDDTVQWSDPAHNIYNLPPNYKLNFSIFIDAVHYDEQDGIRAKFKEALDKKEFSAISCRVITPNKEIRHIFFKGDVVLDAHDNVCMIKGMVQDVTEQQQYLQMLEAQNEKLKEIAWIQSHKVRGPVANILGLTELLNMDEPADPDNLKVLEDIHKAADSLDHIVRSLIDKANTIGLE